MPLPQQHFDWQQVLDEPSSSPVAVTRDRAKLLLGLFAAALSVIFLRAVQLEVSDGDNFRRLAARPIEREVAVPAERGRILARDGSPLAADRVATALAVQYRYLQDPPDVAWLARRARARLTSAERRNADKLAAAETRCREELASLKRRLSALCDLPMVEWQARAGRIDRRVAALAELVNQRRLERFEQQAAAEPSAAEESPWSAVWGLFAPPAKLPPLPVTLVEQTAYHRIVEDVSPAVVAEIQNHPRDYPGVKIVEHTRRDYPGGTVAAHVIGHVGRTSGMETLVASVDSQQPDVDRVVGLLGIERAFDAQLSGRPGVAVQSTDHRGKVLSTAAQQEPSAGRDVVLSIDVHLQRSAEMWLDRGLRRRAGDDARDKPRGGAIAVMDVHTGELVAAASAPRFDPNLLVAGDPRVEGVLADPAQPLFDRVAKMALPPGSVFKPLTALALVGEQAVDPLAAFHCRGYLNEPDRLRCQIFRQQGIGHDDVTMADALAQSCNVYFFHHVDALGGARLVNWATRFGFGEPTGIELADEAAGQLPALAQLRQESQTQALAVGQGAFTATPLQIVRLYAAIANGGTLVTPRITRDRPAGPQGRSHATNASPQGAPIAGLDAAALDAVREGLRRTVDDPRGTAYVSVRLPGLAIAGKTGTAETGGSGADHSWFAGYVPADAPRYSFVVVIEHAGSGAEVAGPVARNVIERMRELGYFGHQETADKTIPPGKG